MATKTDPCGNTTCSDVTGTTHTTAFSYSDSPSGGNAPGNSIVSVRATHLAAGVAGLREAVVMSEEQSLGMKWRSREAAEELVREFEASGLSRKDFCAQRGLSLGTLDLYRKRRRVAGGGGESKAVLARVKISEGQGGGASGLQLVLERKGCGWKCTRGF